MQKHSPANVSYEQNTMKRIENTNPFVVMMYLGIVGIFLMFSLFMLLFLRTSAIETLTNHIQFPYAFFVSTLAILISSFFLEKARQGFKTDNFIKLRNYLALTLSLGILFMLMQAVGAYELHQIHQVYLDSKEIRLGAFLYIISGLHVLHLLGGLVYAAVLLVQYHQKAGDAVKVLITVTNPYEVVKLKLLAIYWHAMDILWLVIVTGFFLALL